MSVLFDAILCNEVSTGKFHVTNGTHTLSGDSEKFIMVLGRTITHLVREDVEHNVFTFVSDRRPKLLHSPSSMSWQRQETIIYLNFACWFFVCGHSCGRGGSTRKGVNGRDFGMSDRVQN